MIEMKTQGMLRNTPAAHMYGSIEGYLGRRNCDEEEPISTPTIPPRQAITPKIKFILNRVKVV